MGEWKRTSVERESTRRVRTALPIRVTTLDPELDQVTGEAFCRLVEETTADLSLGGAFVRSWEPLEAGHRLIVDIDLPGGETLELHARVAWTQLQVRDLTDGAGPIEQPGYGIQFLPSNPTGLQQLRDHLAQTAQPLPTATVAPAAKTESAPGPRSSSDVLRSMHGDAPNP